MTSATTAPITSGWIHGGIPRAADEATSPLRALGDGGAEAIAAAASADVRRLFASSGGAVGATSGRSAAKPAPSTTDRAPFARALARADARQSAESTKTDEPTARETPAPKPDKTPSQDSTDATATQPVAGDGAQAPKKHVDDAAPADGRAERTEQPAVTQSESTTTGEQSEARSTPVVEHTPKDQTTSAPQTGAATVAAAASVRKPEAQTPVNASSGDVNADEASQQEAKGSATATVGGNVAKPESSSGKDAAGEAQVRSLNGAEAAPRGAPSAHAGEAAQAEPEVRPEVVATSAAPANRAPERAKSPGKAAQESGRSRETPPGSVSATADATGIVITNAESADGDGAEEHGGHEQDAAAPVVSATRAERVAAASERASVEHAQPARSGHAENAQNGVNQTANQASSQAATAAATADAAAPRTGSPATVFTFEGLRGAGGTTTVGAANIGGGASAARGSAGSSGEGVSEDAFATTVSRGLGVAVNQRGGTVTLRLQPESLGAMKIQLEIEGGLVQGRFEVTTPEARDLLSKNMETLRSALESRGLSVDRLQVSVATPGDGARGGGAEQQSGQGAGARHTGHDAGDGRSRGSYEGQRDGGGSAGRQPEHDRPRSGGSEGWWSGSAKDGPGPAAGERARSAVVRLAVDTVG